MKKFTLICWLIVTITVFLLSSCGGDSATTTETHPNEVHLVVKQGIVIPNGYTLIEASAYGKFTNILTLYIQQNDSKRVYEYQKGKFGKEIIIPEGYDLIAVSAYGSMFNNRTFYCRKHNTEQIFICSPN